MAFSNSGAVLRADINAMVLEAAAAENFFIGASVLPPLAVTAKSGQYPKFKKAGADLLNADAEARGATAGYARVVREYDNDNYSTVEFGLEELIGDADGSEIARFFDLEKVAANLVRRQVQIGHEARVQAAIQNATTFSATVAPTAYTVANKATADFASDVLGVIDTLNGRGENPNTIVMSGAVFTRIKGQTLFQNFVRGNRPSDITANLSQGAMAQAFADSGINNVYVGRASKNSGNKGAAFTASPIWNNTHIWIGRVESGEVMDGGAGRTFYWSDDSELFTTETYRDEQRRSTVVRVRQHVSEKIIDADAGQLITTGFA